MRPGGRLAAVLGLVALVAAAGCTVQKREAAAVNDDTHVSGTVAVRVAHPPGEGGMTLVVVVGPGRQQTVIVPSLFDGSPPTTVELALQKSADEVQVGDRVTATGVRDLEGHLVAKRLEIDRP